MLTGLMVLVGGGTMIYASVTHQVEARETITHQVAAVIVESGRGDITIHASGARGTVQVIRRGRLRVGSDLAPLEFSDGNTLIIDDQTDDSETSGISYEVRVPAGVRIGATTFSGTIDADGDFSSVVLQTATGTVETELSATTVFAYATRTAPRLTRSKQPAGPATSPSSQDDHRRPPSRAFAGRRRRTTAVETATAKNKVRHHKNEEPHMSINTPSALPVKRSAQPRPGPHPDLSVSCAGEVRRLWPAFIQPLPVGPRWVN